MRVTLVAVGQRMPGWVTEGFSEYSKRLRSRLPIELIEIPAAKRGSGDVARSMSEEGKRMLAAARPQDHVVALDEHGKLRTSLELSRWLAARLQSGNDLVFMVGGADGFAPEVLARADERWSLSALTLPHALVRVVFAEQIYRAVTLLDGHPYHRE
jgi:23S rRNA (pseudouridine1915-N3)-methyltransferase